MAQASETWTDDIIHTGLATLAGGTVLPLVITTPAVLQVLGAQVIADINRILADPSWQDVPPVLVEARP